MSGALNFSPQFNQRQVNESSAAGALDCEVAVVAVDGAGVVPLDAELSPPDWMGLLSGAAADMMIGLIFPLFY